MNEKIKIKGEITANFWRQKNPLLIKWNKYIEKLVKIYPQKRGWIMKNFYCFGNLIKKDKKDNIICNAGFSRVIRGLAGEPTSTSINYMLLGTGTGTPALTNTQLFNEVYRNPTGMKTFSGNVVYLTAYYTPLEVFGTFTEFGNVIEGTSTANTGFLWSHIIVNWTKDNQTSLTVDCKYTIINI